MAALIFKKSSLSNSSVKYLFPRLTVPCSTTTLQELESKFTRKKFTFICPPTVGMMAAATNVAAASTTNLFHEKEKRLQLDLPCWFGALSVTRFRYF